MGVDVLKSYFLSIEPFWPEDYAVSETYREGGVFATRMDWHGEKSLKCVPGNGQVGLMLQEEEDFKGYFYGTISDYEEICMNGIDKGFFVRFNPGAFYNICNIPVNEVDPGGMPMDAILSKQQIARIRDAITKEHPMEALVHQFHHWDKKKTGESHKALVNYVVEKIWNSRGSVMVNSLETDTAYSSRYLREILTQGVGLSPKQMCRQVRFQHALKGMEQAHRSGKVNLSGLACTLGYSDQAHFCRDFKMFCGMTPAEYEKNRILHTEKY